MARPSTCLTCGTPIEQQPGRGRPRVYCSGRCRTTAYTARAATNGLTLLELVERDGVCYLCSEPINAHATGGDAPSIDHVIPVSRGGTWDVSNLRVVHRRCNHMKGGRMFCPHCLKPI